MIVFYKRLCCIFSKVRLKVTNELERRDVHNIVASIRGKYEQGELSGIESRRKEGIVLFNDALNTFYLWLYGIIHMVKYHSDSEKGNLLPPHRLLFPINSKGSFICTIPQTG